MDKRVGEIYEDFVSHVAEGRKLPVQKVCSEFQLNGSDWLSHVSRCEEVNYVNGFAFGWLVGDALVDNRDPKLLAR